VDFICGGPDCYWVVVPEYIQGEESLPTRVKNAYLPKEVSVPADRLMGGL
jgi:hypothetical protein